MARGRPRISRPMSLLKQTLGLEIATTYIPDPSIWKEVDRAARDAVKENLQVIRKEAQRLMSKKAHAESYRKDSGSTGRSKPGELPRSDSGSYSSSIRYAFFRNRKGGFVGPAWPKGAHAGLLKYGTKHMGARLVPSVVALERFQGKLIDSYRDKL